MTACPQCGHENPPDNRFCGRCGAVLERAAAPREVRKVVSVVFCDVTGSTALGETLDPESLRALLARYFDRMRGIVEAHGGTVEKFIGDAVMAVFGVPVLHEDDALRAVRAAAEMRDALPELGLQCRIGVATGEVVTGTRERLATGDAVNVAARLEQAAEPGEILIGANTLRMVRDAVLTEAVTPLELKGKRDPVPAFRLVSVELPVDAPRVPSESPLVGRAQERARLAADYDAAVSQRTCHLFSLLGVAGVGKSRLVAEFLAGLEATIVRGRCLSYGEGITYWPVVEVLIQLGTRPADPAAARVITMLLGESDEAATGDEIAWAVRKTLEQAAAERPVVCVLDDLHWAEPGLLDLVEHVADYSRGLPVFVVCVARPELLERRPGWAGGKLNATTVLLEPLSADETDELIDRLAAVDGALRARIRDAADGNPLFVEEMLAMLRESGGLEVEVPPTIQALLASRIDQLDVSERAVLERGAVEGQVFHRGAVEALAPDEERVSQRLLGLVRKELVRPDQAQIPGDDAYRFRHLLIRDAAYDSLPKAVRGELHERFAAWLDTHGPALVELDEIVGYHLEQACRYRRALGRNDDAGALAVAARARLQAAGGRARLRGDIAAAVNLLERAERVAPAAELDPELEYERADALFEAGRMAEALEVIRALGEWGRDNGERPVELIGRIEEGRVLTHLEPEGASARLDALIAEALPELEAAGDDLALYVAYSARGLVSNMNGRCEAWLDATEHALVHAQRTRQAHLAGRLMAPLGASRLFGPTPVAELLAWLDEQESVHPGNVSNQVHRAAAVAMLGRAAEARELIDGVRERLRDQGATVAYSLITGQVAASIALLAGEPARAVELGYEGRRILEQHAERTWLSTVVGMLAGALYLCDRLDEADAEAGYAAELGSSDDRLTQMLWRQARAKVYARRGRAEEAVRLAREAVAIGEQMDDLNDLGSAYVSLADVLVLTGAPGQAAGPLTRAVELYAQKGNVVSRDRALEELARLSPGEAELG
ncbi:MAG: AAA family ATPase [Gaiellales bacterium]